MVKDGNAKKIAKRIAAEWLPNMLDQDQRALVDVVSQNLDRDHALAGAFCVALLEDANMHSEAATLNSSLSAAVVDERSGLVSGKSWDDAKAHIQMDGAVAKREKWTWHFHIGMDDSEIWVSTKSGFGHNPYTPTDEDLSANDWQLLYPETKNKGEREAAAIPDDGFADGGTPYTDEEMDIIDRDTTYNHCQSCGARVPTDSLISVDRDSTSPDSGLMSVCRECE